MEKKNHAVAYVDGSYSNNTFMKMQKNQNILVDDVKMLL